MNLVKFKDQDEKVMTSGNNLLIKKYYEISTNTGTLQDYPKLKLGLSG